MNEGKNAKKILIENNINKEELILNLQIKIFNKYDLLIKY